MFSAIQLGPGGVAVDSSSYHITASEAWAEVVIPVTFTNPMGGEVRIPSCHSPYPPVLEKLTENGWVVAYRPVVLLCITPPVRVRSGEQYQMLYHVIAGLAPNTGPRFQVPELTGTYRVNWQALRTSSGSALPEEARVSEPFELVEVTNDGA